MDRAEATGLGVAVAGHAALLAALSLGLASVTRPMMQSDPIEVSFVDEVGLQAAVTEAQMEDPAEAMAPELGPMEEAAPATPDAPAPEPTPVERATEPAPTPQPKQASQPTPAKPEPKAKPKEKPRSSRLGEDFLKGITDKAKGKATKPRAAVSSRDMASLAQAIIRQIKPCYVVPAGGIDIDEIMTVFRVRLNRNGSVRGVDLIEQNGVNSANRDYARQVAEAARRAMLRCAPLDLPAELYEGGWDDMDIGFRPSSLG